MFSSLFDKTLCTIEMHLSEEYYSLGMMKGIGQLFDTEKVYIQ